MGLAQRLTAVGTLARANIGWFERPDRMIAGIAAAVPWGASTTAALALAVGREPRRAALVDDEGALTYHDLWRRSDGVAHALVALGAGPDVTVGVLCRNHRGFTDALLGASKTGANIVLLNTGFAGPQLADVVAAEGISIVVHDDGFAAQAADCPHGVATVDGSALQQMAASGERVSPTAHQGRVVILTSGTTGRPKGATRGTGSGAIEGVAGILARIPLRPRDVQVVAAPLFHAWGLSHLMLGLTRCATSVVATRFDAEATVGAVAEHSARVLVVVPVMLRRMLSVDPQVLAAADTSALRVIAVSGSALGGQLATDVADRFGPVLYNTYGSTEVAVASVATPSDLRRHPTTVGKPAPGAVVEILDDAGEPLPNGTVGRIFVGNSARFEGYTGGGGKESQRGLLSSGDVGHIDRDGFLYVDGRDDDMIVSGGENLFPSEVEELLNQHPAVGEAAVIGVADEEFGQVLAAFIVRRPSASLDADGVKEYVRDHLARFKVPKRIEFVDELPRNATGKILKRDLAAR
ncbi:MAG: AMP-binding protein [Ilumatobacteraceae bacterium]